MSELTSIHKLSNDILRDILDFIDIDPDRSVNIDRRAYLSVESFRPPSPPPPLRAQDIGNFRLTCRRFADLGIPHQYTRVATRFSVAGLDRLDRISSCPHLARHTKKFSYLIPDFYREGRTRVRELLDHANGDLHNMDAAFFEKKAQVQRTIVDSGQDIQILRRAMSAFRNLQHVQILRLQDEADRCLIDYIREDPAEQLTHLVDLDWSLACTHASRTVGEALAYTRSPFSRFSGPMMNAQSALAFIERVPKELYFLAERLTCLELHFEDSAGLQERIIELSPLFKNVFHAARNMQALHIGFPSRSPLRIPLRTVFHEIRWEKLRAFGVQAWRLDADEIISLARRHSKTLRGLRLRDVLLLEGSLWRDVLEMLREEMDTLEWVSLRRIDYSDHFDKLWAGSMEVPDYPPSGSDSDDEASYHALVDNHDHDHHSEPDWDDFSEEQSNADTDHGPEADEIALSPDTPASVPFCTCSRSSYPTTADDLGDNGGSVIHQQRKLWEKWVIGRCPEHGPP